MRAMAWGLMIAAAMACLGWCQRALAVAGTSQVAAAGQEAYISPSWPEGVRDFLADPVRGNGYNDWFSEWPNDVNQYEYRIESTQQLSELIEKFGRIKGQELHIHLSPLAEPRGYGWVSSFPEGNGTPVIFSIGDQARIDQWYAGLGGRKFGVMEFEKAPTAVPPTLTIYVQHKAIDLDELKIPESIHVTAGDVPRVFHVANLKKPKEKPTPPAPPAERIEDPALQKAVDRIEAFVNGRKKESTLESKPN